MSLNPNETSELLFDEPSSTGKWTARPTASILSRRLVKMLGGQEKSLADVASKTWEVSPGSMLVTRPAFYLPNQLERVTGRVYGYHWDDSMDPKPLEQEMAGGVERLQRPTMGYLLKDAYLVDGAIHKSGAVHRMLPRTSTLPQFEVETEIQRGAAYGTYDGNIFFGLWLSDDCTIYPLARNEGIPFTTDQEPYSHSAAYEDWFKMRGTRLGSAHFRELVVFDDRLQNQSKRDRFDGLRKKLLERFPAKSHAGVFIVRGGSGKARVLHNERELAEHLRVTRGFRVVDVNVNSPEEIISACAGAQTMVGVEGSHVFHAFMIMQPGTSTLMIQPPDRFSPVIKRTTDRDDQNYGFVVAHPEVGGGYRVDITEVERTLDLFPKM